jgi:hypothetical protein
VPEPVPDRIPWRIKVTVPGTGSSTVNIYYKDEVYLENVTFATWAVKDMQKGIEKLHRETEHHPYNIGLVASVIAEEESLRWDDQAVLRFITQISHIQLFYPEFKIKTVEPIIDRDPLYLRIGVDVGVLADMAKNMRQR